jgi:hypothetical protein
MASLSYRLLDLGQLLDQVAARRQEFKAGCRLSGALDRQSGSLLCRLCRCSGLAHQFRR